MSSTEWSGYVRDELGVDLSPEQISDEVVARLGQHYRARLPLLPGAREAVERMARHWPLGLASSSNRELIDLVLDVGGLARYFQVTVSSEEVARGKPAPDVYLEAARRLGAAPGRCAAIEDSQNGILSAAAAGMRVIAIPNPVFPPGADALAAAAEILPDPGCPHGRGRRIRRVSTVTDSRALDTLSVNTIRTLAMDAVQRANSGHPGTPMALAPVAYVLYTRIMRHSPSRPGLARPRPLRAVGGPRVDAALLDALPDRVRPHARRPQELPPARQPDRRPPRVPACGRHRGDHRAARPGDLDVRRAWRWPSACSPRVSTTATTRWSTTARSRSRATATCRRA